MHGAFCERYGGVRAPYKERAAQRRVLRLFHSAATRVPAYRDFLRVHEVRPSSIKTVKDFCHVPLTDKQNYILRYPLHELCWDGDLHHGGFIVSSTGTTGEPLFWPRFRAQHRESVDAHERILRDIFFCDRIATLAVVCFSMGIHIAGTVTALGIQGVSERGYPLCTVTPSIKMDAIMRCVTRLSPHFGQTLLIGYPPFIRDVLEEGARQGVDWKALNTRLLFAAEGVIEPLRDLMHSMVGAHDALGTSCNIYGCADAGLLAHETPVSIYVRRAACADDGIARALCGVKKELMPPLYSYDPRERYFESINSELVFTVSSRMPLIRYNIHDRGGILSYDALQDKMRGFGISVDTFVRKNGYAHSVDGQPFVYVFGRTDDSVTLYGLNIFQEHIRFALSDPLVNNVSTGKFVLFVDYTEDLQQRFNVVLESRPGVVVQEKDVARIRERMIALLRKVNAEYNALCEAVGERAYPHVHMRLFQDVEFFAPGVKHRWKR